MSSKLRCITPRDRKSIPRTRERKEQSRGSTRSSPGGDNQATATSPLLLLLPQDLLDRLLDIRVVLARLGRRMRAVRRLHELHNPARDRVHVGRAELALCVGVPRVRQQPPRGRRARRRVRGEIRERRRARGRAADCVVAWWWGHRLAA